MKTYTINNFIHDKIAVVPANDDERRRFLAECDKHSLVWCQGGEKASEWDKSGLHPIGYNAPEFPNTIAYWHLDDNESHGYKTVPFSAFDFAQPAPARHEIHITSDGATTHAVYKLDGKIVKRTKAVCAPGDAYDFIPGANLAYERLAGKKPVEPLEIVCGAGDIGVSVNKEGDTLRIDRLKKPANVGSFIPASTDDAPLFRVRFTNPNSVDVFIHHLKAISKRMHTEAKRKPAPEYDEVERPAKVGEKIKIVNADSNAVDYTNGDVLTVIRPDYSVIEEIPCGWTFYENRMGAFCYQREYVVLVPRKKEA